MGYWTKKENYEQVKKFENIIKVYNPKTKEDEFIKLSDYLNSYADFKNEVNNENRSKKNTETLKLFNEKITEKINIQNITDEETDEAEKVKKLYTYFKNAEEEFKKSKENN